jgi:AcrR family transcriptional regulator
VNSTTADGPPTGRANRRSAGERSRAAILDQAARLATVDGLAGLSIARLAAAVGMSKSGLFAHFGSKEDLQLATVERAKAIFAERVVETARPAPAAIAALRDITDRYLDYVESDTFPGGCFFGSTLVEMSMQPGPVRDRLVQFLADWMQRLESMAREAQAEGSFSADEDPRQIAFDLEAALFLANAQYTVTRSAEPIRRARDAIDRRLTQA